MYLTNPVAKKGKLPNKQTLSKQLICHIRILSEKRGKAMQKPLGRYHLRCSDAVV